jgi:cytochrome c-type protein NapC
MHNVSLITLFALACAGLAAVILLGYLVRRPVLSGAVKVWLLLGLGVLPISAAVAGNVQGYEASKKRSFCGSCHVMIPQVSDAEDPTSPSLASRHARNHLFGEENCYVCHADYGMFGTITTKLGGMKHVWMYYTQYRTTPIEDANETIALYEPFPNENCMQCHSTQLNLWQRVPDHRAALADVRAERVSCASAGCHGTAHPSTPGRQAMGGR